MNKTKIISARQQSDGSMVQVLADGSVEPLEDKSGRERLDAMTDDEITAAALSDPDTQPLNAEQLKGARRVPRVKTLRRALGLTQEEFAAR